ncbi:hypothetical protein [Streptococcus equinus]|uniref:hypothetical protein n=1 Tax=Streptococcus equinus TaxID=1335 RepID=UPI001F3D2AF9|nr:hypothetical protein [Streptococcus equinus]
MSQDGKLTLSALAYDDNGEAVSQVSSLTGGFILYYYPAGKQIPNWHFNITDILTLLILTHLITGVTAYLLRSSADSTTSQHSNS